MNLVSYVWNKFCHLWYDMILCILLTSLLSALMALTFFTSFWRSQMMDPRVGFDPSDTLALIHILYLRFWDSILSRLGFIYPNMLCCCLRYPGLVVAVRWVSLLEPIGGENDRELTGKTTWPSHPLQTEWNSRSEFKKQKRTSYQAASHRIQRRKEVFVMLLSNIA